MHTKQADLYETSLLLIKGVSITSSSTLEGIAFLLSCCGQFIKHSWSISYGEALRKCGGSHEQV